MIDTIEVLLDGIAQDNVANLDPTKLDESALRFISKEVLDVDFSSIPRTVLAVRDFRKMFLNDLSVSVVEHETDLETLLRELERPKRLSANLMTKDELPTLEIHSTKSDYTLTILTQKYELKMSGDRSKILNELAKVKVKGKSSVSNKRLQDIVDGDAKKVTDSVSNINKRFRAATNSQITLIEIESMGTYTLKAKVVFR